MPIHVHITTAYTRNIYTITLPHPLPLCGRTSKLLLPQKPKKNKDKIRSAQNIIAANRETWKRFHEQEHTASKNTEDRALAPEALVVEEGPGRDRCAPCQPVEKPHGEQGIRKIQFKESLDNRRVSPSNAADGRRKGKKRANRTRKHQKENKRKNKEKSGHEEPQVSRKGLGEKPTLLRSFSESSFMKLLQGRARKAGQAGKMSD
ncbi:hypothetical protein P171DRAFT_437278 [Karstenula rhodostoma CBS 690.94]|uniref:Uncharacterized protein n=1 Tax=Karstenula rhodostoma CBS 690.94 TaxID=1392251 RepID=A0A9P4U4Q5_9PLEO|nr:hypothetical protein P171DRAFT_437278 [Karstenula rhodostoma CBS 690.94]